MEPMKRARITIVLYLLILFVNVLAPALSRQQKLVGGELFASDFKDGFRLYVTESYIINYNPNMTSSTTPHSTWMVTDEELKNAVYRLCRDIKSHIINDPVRFLAGTPSFLRVSPQIIFITESYGYKMRSIDWRNYKERDAYSMGLSDFFGEPVFYFSRIDLTKKPTDIEDALGYIKSYSHADSVNHSLTNGYGAGWISTMPRKSFDELLNILNAIDNTVAGVYVEAQGE
jgi:hypothetical protein